MAVFVTPGMKAVLACLATKESLFVLRGGIVLAHYISPIARPIDDLDLLATVSSFDAEALRSEFAGLVDDSEIAILSDEVIWEETDFPGLRHQLRIGEETLQVDIGFGDPLVESSVAVELWPGLRVQACRPETLYAWKLHGLFERGKGRWRAKDLHDLLLLRRHATLATRLLQIAIPLAFESRGDSLMLLDRLLDGEFGKSRSSLRKWRRFSTDRELTEAPLPTLLQEVADFVASVLAKATVAG